MKQQSLSRTGLGSEFIAGSDITGYLNLISMLVTFKEIIFLSRRLSAYRLGDNEWIMIMLRLH